MYIHQITVFLENMKGTLSKLTTLLADNHIDILAMSIADTSGFERQSCPACCPPTRFPPTSENHSGWLLPYFSNGM